MRRAFLAAALALVAPAAHAQQLIGSYVAFLSWNDHYNSNGVQLTSPAQIIRQDRANVHRYGIADPGDEWDSFFGSTENRAIAEQMIANGYMEPGLASRIVNNEVTVLVEIYGYGGTGQYLNVTVY